MTDARDTGRARTTHMGKEWDEDDGGGDGEASREKATTTEMMR